MASNNTTDLRNGVVGEVGCKYPATVVSLTNITLEGYQTINGVSLTDEMIVLVKGQTDKTENGIYIPSTGEWTRAVWFDDELDATNGTLIFTSLGTQYSNTLWRTVCADDPIIFGTSEIDFELVVSGNNTGDVTLSGQNYLTLVNQALTANKISLANMANLAANSFIANNTGSLATPQAITSTQATEMLNVMVGDSGSGGTKGLVPAPASGDANKFLRGNGLWSTNTIVDATTSTKGISLLPSKPSIANNTSDSNYDIDFGAYTMQFSDGSGQAVQGSKTKRADATWALGNNNGGMAAGVSLSNNTWYYMFALASDDDDSVVDYGFDTSQTASNLLADSAIIAAGLTKYQFIGVFKTNGSAQIINGTWFKDGTFVFKSALLIFSMNGAGDGTVSNIMPPLLCQGNVQMALNLTQNNSSDLSVYGNLQEGLNDYTYVSTITTNNNFRVAGYGVVYSDNGSISYKNFSVAGGVSYQAARLISFKLLNYEI